MDSISGVLIMYKLVQDSISKQTVMIQRLSDKAFIPMVEENADYQVYLKWLAEGNEPLAADE